MNEASPFDKFDYRFRPAKSVERNMVCEALGRLSAIGRLDEYRYVAFGAVGFSDFALFHQRLGISDMISLDHNRDHRMRLERNRPYSCIRILPGDAGESLPTLGWERKRCVVWLDYKLEEFSSRMITEPELVAEKARSGSVLLVTLNVDSQGKPKEHFKRVAEVVDTEGYGIKPASLSKWGYAKVAADILSERIKKTVNDRNGGIPERDHVRFHQLFNFVYRDDLRTLTFGGIFVGREDEERFRSANFGEMAFIRDASSDQFEISVPALTLREIKYLDSRLPRLGTDGRLPTWIPLVQRNRYKKVYRYFPNAHELEAC